MERALELLADGAFHSGEELGSILSISRAAIWKKLKMLEELGLQVDSVKGKGLTVCQLPGTEDHRLKRRECGVQQKRTNFLITIVYFLN